MIRRLTENWGWKLLAFVIALALWVIFIGDEELTTTIAAPVQYRNIPKDEIISSDVVDTVRLQLRGPSAKLNRLARENVSVQLNLGDTNKTGERTFTIREEDLGLPPGIRLDRAMPSQVRLKLEYRASREVPVDVRFGGPPPEGYRLDGVDVEPAKVWIVGPESNVHSTDAVETDAIDLQRMLNPGKTSYHVNVFVEDPHVSIRDTDEVTVTVDLEHDAQKKGKR
jgi:YbbR domain-containing protein